MHVKLFERKFLAGMIHLPPMPGSKGYPGLEKVIKKALLDLHTLEQAGFDAALVENDDDRPQQVGVSKELSDAFLAVMKNLEKEAKIPLGMQIIYDMEKTIEIAAKADALFVRLDVFVDSVLTRWGKVLAEPDKIIELRDQLDPHLLLFTDVHVKHGKMLERKTLTESATEAISKGSDAIIVTGSFTGIPPSVRKCLIVKKASKKVPVLVGSGLTIDNAPKLLKIADGAIVGTSIKEGKYVSYAKAKALADLVHSLSA